MIWVLLLVAAAPDEATLSRVEVACASIDRALGGPPQYRSVRVEVAPTIEAFVARTGRARFEAAATKGMTIWLQPPSVLDKLPDVDLVLRHECVHALLRARGVPPLHVVLEEAVALELSGQAAKLPPARPITSDADHDELARILAKPRDRAAFEGAVARASSTYGQMVSKWLREGTLIGSLIASRRP